MQLPVHGGAVVLVVVVDVVVVEVVPCGSHGVCAVSHSARGVPAGGAHGQLAKQGFVF